MTLLIYKIFKNSKDYSFKDQIQRASISVMKNISEGFERGSKQDFKRFLYIAKASCGEVRSMLYLAIDIGYISKEEFNRIHSNCMEISKLIAGLIKTL